MTTLSQNGIPVRFTHVLRKSNASYRGGPNRGAMATSRCPFRSPNMEQAANASHLEGPECSSRNKTRFGLALPCSCPICWRSSYIAHVSRRVPSGRNRAQGRKEKWQVRLPIAKAIQIVGKE